MTEVVVGRDETLDVLCEDKLQIIQKKNGYRFSIDPILLANFIALKKHERILDIGSGCGIIPVYLTKKGYTNEMLGVEIQKDLYDLSLRNKAINHCENVNFIHGDITAMVQRLTKKSPLHVVISNLYTKEKTGRKKPHHSRSVARYDTFLNLGSYYGILFLLFKRRFLCHLSFPKTELSSSVSPG